MQIFVRQESKELFGAKLLISDGSKEIGSISLEEKLHESDSRIKIRLENNNYYLVGKKNRKETLRLYGIEKNGIEVGEIYHTSKKTGLFGLYGYQHALLEGKEYDLYPVGLGKEGEKYPVYQGNEQIGLVLIDRVIVNDMHDYQIIIRELSDLEPVILFIAYIYAVASFKSNVKEISSYRKTYHRTTNKELLSKYDKRFEETYGD